MASYTIDIEPGLLTKTPTDGLPIVINGQQVVTEGGYKSVRKNATMVSVSTPTGYVNVTRYFVILDLTNLRIEEIYMDEVTNQVTWTNDEAGVETAVEDIKEALTSGGGGGGGTVTSVALSAGTTGFGVSGSPVTTTGTLTLTGFAAVRTGNTLWVDAVNGNDGTGTPDRQDLPYLTPAAALTDATSGDTIHVLAGSYTTTVPLSKNGVNWFFLPGASVSMTTDTDGAIFDDRSGAQSFVVGGYGAFTRGETVQPEDFSNVIHVSNASSVITIWCDTILNTANEESSNEGGPGTAAIYHANGSLTVNAKLIEAQGYAYYWKVGPAWINADEIISNGNAAGDGDGVLCRPPDGNTDNVFVRAHSITSVQKSAVYSSLADSSAPDFRLWVTSEVIAGGSVGVQAASGKVYITAQKISASLDSGAVVKANGPVGTELYVNAQKIASADSLTSATIFTLVEASEMKVRITCMEYDVSSIVTWSATNGLFNVTSISEALDFECWGGTISAPSAITTPIIANSGAGSGGRRLFKDMRFDNTIPTTPDAPIVLTDDVTILQNCTIVTASTVSIDASSAHDVISYATYANVAVDGNVTVNGDLIVGAYVV